MFPLLLLLHLSAASAFELSYRACAPPYRYISFPQMSAVQRLTSANGSLPLSVSLCVSIVWHAWFTPILNRIFAFTKSRSRLRHPSFLQTRPETEI
uniref:Putative secreted peptide n=1 Tax=Anopheles braziliensis TaxID=58242 RepID=A0A2M3ZSI1_9DIPT